LHPAFALEHEEHPEHRRSADPLDPVADEEEGVVLEVSRPPDVDEPEDLEDRLDELTDCKNRTERSMRLILNDRTMLSN
jgi:hypothetical protein